MFNLYIEKVTISILNSDVQSKHVHDTCYGNNYIILCLKYLYSSENHANHSVNGTTVKTLYVKQRCSILTPCS